MNTTLSSARAPLTFKVTMNFSRQFFVICIMLVSAMFKSENGYCIATRYQVTASAVPIGSGSICQGSATGIYTHQPSRTSCTVVGSANTNTITYQWVYDGTTIISGASGTFVVGASTPPVVTLSSTHSAILSTLSIGAHTLRCRYTPNQSNCSGSAGVAIFSPTLSINVLTPPGSITGPPVTCVGLSELFSASPGGGTWVSSNTTTATIISSGLLSGLSPGTTTISYTLPSGCRSTFVTTVNAASAPISGTSNICEFVTATLTHPVAGGTWSSSSPAIVSVSGGDITGVSTGMATITYTLPSGCYVTQNVTVITGPQTISGSSQVCAGESTTLSNSVAGGTWSSGSLAIATISGTGVVAGLGAGVTNIVYSLSNGCATEMLFSVNPLPGITFSPSSAATVCLGQTATITASSPDPEFALLSQNFDGGLSGWSIQNILGTPSSYWQIVTPPGTDGTAGDGTPMMQAASSTFGGFTHTRLSSPGFSTLGYGSATLTFNQYLISTAPDVHALLEYSVDGGTSWTTITDQVNAFSG
ncbi:MAG: Ig-like domain-containing protein, partial [Taibaiella sp.]|nr:Ig-like domain-containing protein [Taibaiella sp.]